MILFGAPYWLCQYGLLHFRHFARLLRRGRPISLSLNTGSGSGYVLVSLRAYAYVARLLPVGQYAVPVFWVATTAR